MRDLLPVTTHSVPDWIRRAAALINSIRNDVSIVSKGQIGFIPQAEPSNPVEGQTYMDATTHKLRTYDGSAWRDHW